MYLALPTLQFFKEKVNKQTVQQPVWQSAYGVTRTLSGKQWVLVKKQTATRIPVAKIKDNVQIENILTDKSTVVELKPGYYAAIQSNPLKISIQSRQQYGQILKIGSEGQDEAVTVSQIISSFKNFQQFKQSALYEYTTTNITKQDPVNKFVVQYHNKHLRNMQAYMVPVYMKETGNWHDTQYVKLNIKQL